MDLQINKNKNKKKKIRTTTKLKKFDYFYLAKLIKFYIFNNIIIAILANNRERKIQPLVCTIRAITENSHASPVTISTMGPND